MSLDLKRYYWVVKPPMSYKSVDDLMGGFELGVVERARAKHEELQRKKAEDQQAEPSVPASAFYKKYEG